MIQYYLFLILIFTACRLPAQNNISISLLPFTINEVEDSDSLFIIELRFQIINSGFDTVRFVKPSFPQAQHRVYYAIELLDSVSCERYVNNPHPQIGVPYGIEMPGIQELLPGEIFETLLNIEFGIKGIKNTKSRYEHYIVNSNEEIIGIDQLPITLKGRLKYKIEVVSPDIQIYLQNNRVYSTTVISNWAEVQMKN